MLPELLEEKEVRDREIGEKILKLRRFGILALDASIVAFEARGISQCEIVTLAEKVAQMSELLQELEFGSSLDPDESRLFKLS
jgi:hypothetical protein